MNKLLITTVGTLFLVLAGGAASAQSPVMYTLDDIYYYLVEGTEAVEGGYPLEPPPGSVPGDTRFKTLKEIYQDVQALFDRCDALPSDVAGGKTFFSTETGSWGVVTGTIDLSTGLLRTGQTTSYSDYDDGWYEKGAAYDYTDNEDGTVTDNVTGLIWARDGNGAGCGDGSQKDWHQALSWAEGLTFAGYSDWRLPNLRELYSLIVEDASYSPGPYIHPGYFPNTKLDHYWTSTTSPLVPARDALSLIFNECVISFSFRSRPCSVRAVRGGDKQ